MMRDSALLLHRVSDRTPGFSLHTQTRKHRCRTRLDLLFITSNASVYTFCWPIPVNKWPEMDYRVKGGQKVFCGGIKKKKKRVLLGNGEKTHLVFSEWLMSEPSSPPSAPSPFFFVWLSLSVSLSRSLSFHYELIGSQRGNLNCNLKAFPNNFDSLRVAHRATCRANERTNERGEKEEGCEKKLYGKQWANEGRRATISIPEALCVTNYVWALWQGGCWVQ